MWFILSRRSPHFIWTSPFKDCMAWPSLTFSTKQPNYSGKCGWLTFFFLFAKVPCHRDKRPLPVSPEISPMLVRTTHLAPIISQNKCWHSLSYILNSHPPPVISRYSSGLRRVLQILRDNIISPFLATILLAFSVNCWNPSFNNRFLMQTCSVDALTWSSGHQEHTCQTLNTLWNWPCTCRSLMVEFETTQGCVFLFAIPSFVL